LLTVGSELVPSICGYAYGPQEPFAALVTQEAVGVEAGVEPVGDGLGEEDGVGELVGADAELDGVGEELVGAEVEPEGVAEGLVDGGAGDGVWWGCPEPCPSCERCAAAVAAAAAAEAAATPSCGAQPAEATAMAATVTATAATALGLDRMIMNSCLSSGGVPGITVR
jgi:hypothetical protein